MELKDTVKNMNSSDYKERFIAEYQQVHIRAKKLQDVIVKYDAGTLEFKPDTPVYLLRKQLRIMNQYLYILRVRAEHEKIELED